MAPLKGTVLALANYIYVFEQAEIGMHCVYLRIGSSSDLRCLNMKRTENNASDFKVH